MIMITGLTIFFPVLMFELLFNRTALDVYQGQNECSTYIQIYSGSATITNHFLT
jgi:hypothetical protein